MFNICVVDLMNNKRTTFYVSSCRALTLNHIYTYTQVEHAGQHNETTPEVLKPTTDKNLWRKV